MRVILFWGFVIDRSKPGSPPPDPRSAMLLFGSIIFTSGEQSTTSLLKTSCLFFLAKILCVLLNSVARSIYFSIFSCWDFLKVV